MAHPTIPGATSSVLYAMQWQSRSLCEAGCFALAWLKVGRVGRAGRVRRWFLEVCLESFAQSNSPRNVQGHFQGEYRVLCAWRYPRYLACAKLEGICFLKIKCPTCWYSIACFCLTEIESGVESLTRIEVLYGAAGDWLTHAARMGDARVRR